MDLIDKILSIGGLLSVNEVDSPEYRRKMYERWQQDKMSRKEFERYMRATNTWYDDYEPAYLNDLE